LTQDKGVVVPSKKKATVTGPLEWLLPEGPKEIIDQFVDRPVLQELANTFAMTRKVVGRLQTLAVSTFSSCHVINMERALSADVVPRSGESK